MSALQIALVVVGGLGLALIAAVLWFIGRAARS